MNRKGLSRILIGICLGLVLIISGLAAACSAASAATPTPTPTFTPTPTAAPTSTPTPTATPVPTTNPTQASSTWTKPSGELVFAANDLLNEVLFPTMYTTENKFYQTIFFDYLIGVDDNGKPDPSKSIAYKWEVARDRKSVTFYIRSGVKFSNGDPLGPEDVKYTLDSIFLPTYNSTPKGDFLKYTDHTEVVPPDEVVVYLKQPWVAQLDLLSARSYGEGMILPKNYIQKVGIDGFVKNPVGSGPYKLYDYKPGNYIKFQVVDNHWRVGVPKYQYITFKKMPEEGTRVAALSTGEVDITPISRARISEVQKAGKNVYAKKDSQVVQVMPLRMYNPDNPLSNLKVRQAMAYAIDKQAIIDSILKGKGSLTGSFYPFMSYNPAFPSPEEAAKRWPPIPYDVDKAKQLLAEAGYSKGFDLTFYSLPQGIPEVQSINQAIAAYFEAIGIRVKMVKMDLPTFTRIWQKEVKPATTAALATYVSGNNVSAQFPVYTNVKANFYAENDNPEVARLIQVLDAQTTTKGNYDVQRQLFDRIYQQLYRTPVCFVDNVVATSEKITDWKLGYNMYDYNLEYLFRQNK